jgi:hypothetical protein
LIEPAFEFVSAAEQLAVEPPLVPEQDHDHGPKPLTEEAKPVVQRLVDGALVTPTPLADPHAPLTGVAGLLAEQLVLVPPLRPVQVQDHGPVPLIGVAVPAVQRLVVGVVETVAPFALPQAPLTAAVLLAEQLAVVPPFDPVHDHDQGPLPVIAVAVPVEQKLPLGAVETVVPLAVPQVPLTFKGAVQEAAVPPLDPEHDQVNGPVPLTDVAEPVAQRLVEGALVTPTPSAVPQAPFRAAVLLAEQGAVVPPLEPEQLHDHGPDPLTLEAEPVEQRLVVGADEIVVRFALPHTPLTGEAVLFAEQLAVAPPSEPTQDHDQGPVPLTDEARPVVQRLVMGVDGTVVPFALPHTPFTGEGFLLAEQLAFVPPPEPAQDQFHGPAPLTDEAEPIEQRLMAGAELAVAPLADPHTPFTIDWIITPSGAEQLALVPPLTAAQLHFQARLFLPPPETAEALPAEQRPEAGLAGTCVLLAAPQAPLIFSGALQAAVVPLLTPAQLQVKRLDAVVTEEALPVLQRLETGAV